MTRIDMNREQYSEKEWLKALLGKSDSGRTVVVVGIRRKLDLAQV